MKQESNGRVSEDNAIARGEGREGKDGLKEGRSHNTYLLADHLLQRWPVSPLSSHLQTLFLLQGRVLRYLFLLVAVVC